MQPQAQQQPRQELEERDGGAEPRAKRALVVPRAESLARQVVRQLVAGARDYAYLPLAAPSPSELEEIVRREAPQLDGISQKTLRLVLEVAESSEPTLEKLGSIGFFRTAWNLRALQNSLPYVGTSNAMEYLDERGVEGMLLLAAATGYPLYSPLPRALPDRKRELAMFANGLLTDADSIERTMRAEVELQTREAVKAGGFFSMKISEVDPEIARSAFAFREACPLWDRYGNGKVLGAGQYSLVVRYARREYDASDGLPLFYVVKFQRTRPSQPAALDPAFVELRLLYWMNASAAHWSEQRRRDLHHHIALYDWVKCDVSLKKAVEPIIPQYQRDKYAKFMGDGTAQQYQIVVQEHASEGDLERFIESNKMLTQRFGGPLQIAALFAQVFGALYPFYKRGFTYVDLKPANILVERVKPSHPVQTLVYSVGRGRSLYVPLHHSHSMLYKFGDLGISTVKGPQLSIGNPARRYAPGIDVETLVCWVMAAFCHTYREDYPGEADPETVHYFRELVLPPINDGSAEDSNRFKVYELLRANYAPGLKANDWEEDIEAFLQMYQDSQKVWSRDPRPEHSDMRLVNAALESGFLARYHHAPEDLTDSNSLVMNDYRPK